MIPDYVGDHENSIALRLTSYTCDAGTSAMCQAGAKFIQDKKTKLVPCLCLGEMGQFPLESPNPV